MKTEDTLHHYYENEINNIEIPPCPTNLMSTPVSGNIETAASKIFRIAFAACIALAFIPLIYSANRPTTLAVRAAETCRTYDLNTRITSGLLDFHNIASKSISSGGKK